MAITPQKEPISALLWAITPQSMSLADNRR